MMGFQEAFDYCLKVFLKHGYSGVDVIHQTDEAWVFWPKTDGREYGSLAIVVPRNEQEPFFYDWTPEDKKRYIDNAVIIR